MAHYLLCILSSEGGKKSVISFLIEANPFNRVCLFCIFVGNKIYVKKILTLELARLARYHKFGSVQNLLFWELMF